jgi:hypothetical protein
LQFKHKGFVSCIASGRNVLVNDCFIENILVTGSYDSSVLVSSVAISSILISMSLLIYAHTP